MGGAVLLLLFGSEPAPIDGFGRLEYTMPLQQLDYTLAADRPEFTVRDERLEFTGVVP